MEPDPRELDLVKEAITARVSGCCEWQQDAMERVNRDRELAHWGLTPRLIKELLIEHVEAGGLSSSASKSASRGGTTTLSGIA